MLENWNHANFTTIPETSATFSTSQSVNNDCNFHDTQINLKCSKLNNFNLKAWLN